MSHTCVCEYNERMNPWDACHTHCCCSYSWHCHPLFSVVHKVPCKKSNQFNTIDVCNHNTLGFFRFYFHPLYSTDKFSIRMSWDGVNYPLYSLPVAGYFDSTPSLICIWQIQNEDVMGRSQISPLCITSSLLFRQFPIPYIQLRIQQEDGVNDPLYALPVTGYFVCPSNYPPNQAKGKCPFTGRYEKVILLNN